MWDAKAGADLRDFRENTLEWSQGRLAAELGCNQSTVSRIEAGEPPSGPVLRLIDILRERMQANGRARDFMAPAAGEAAA